MSVIGAVSALRVYEDNSLGVQGGIPIPVYFVLSGKTSGIPVRIEIVDPPSEKTIPDKAAIPVYLVADPNEKVVGNVAIRVYDINA